MKKKNWKIIGILIACQMLFYSGCGIQDAQIQTNAVQETEGDLTVTFLDVGQGNATLIESDGKYMLIDGGDRGYSSFVVSYLKDVGVEELEYVISSHYDADHLNGIVGVLHAFPCNMVLASDYVTDTRIYDSFREVVTEQELELVYPEVGEVYEFGDAEFTVVCPDHYDYADENDNSVGIRLVHGENSFLICGDAGTASETAMMQSSVLLDSDVYLASHHGSAGSSSREFLEAVSPEVVVFSVGKDNNYGHPSERVLNDVAAMGAEIYRTDRQGTISVTSDGQNLVWSTEAMKYISDEVKPQEEINALSEDVVLSEVQVYTLNRNTKKFHLPTCTSVGEISNENRAEFQGTREELLEAGYDACKRCNP